MKLAISACILVFAFLCVSTSYVCAQTTVTVSDATDPVPEQPHSQTFSNTMNATVGDPPVTNSELTVSGPTWSWSVSPSTPFTISGTSASATLSDSSLPLPGGYNTLKVTATATYIETNNSTGIPSSISYSGSCNVLVPILYPVDFTATLDDYGTVTTGSTAYGHATVYTLSCNSNFTGTLYSWGSAVENLQNAMYNSLYSSYIIADGGVGTGDSVALDGTGGAFPTGVPGTVFDANSMFDWAWPSPYGGSNTGPTTLWATCDQHMSVNDVSPATVLNTFTLYHYQAYCLR
jgi:hypothetical protein